MGSSAQVALSLGGNIGDVRRTFDDAFEILEKSGLARLRRSSIYRTEPVGFDSEVPDFLNAVVIGLWRGSVEELHLACNKAERLLGRPEKHESWASRTIDVDIILFGDEIVSTSSLTIPHPEAQKRFFVLSPLCEIAGNWMFPDTGATVMESLEKLIGEARVSEVVAIEDWRPIGAKRENMRRS